MIQVEISPWVVFAAVVGSSIWLALIILFELTNLVNPEFRDSQLGPGQRFFRVCAFNLVLVTLISLWRLVR